MDRTWISTKLLDLAEELPPTERGQLGHLQLVRLLQREHTEKWSPKGTPPGENQLSFSLVRLAEAYSIERFDRLRATLRRLFPNLPQQDYGRAGLGKVDEMLRSLTATSWWRIGTLLRDSKGRIFAGPVSVIRDLPVSVDYIEVALHHILPSVAVLTLDVQFSDRVSKELNDVQASAYLSEVTFRSLLRWKSGHVEVPAELIRRRHVRAWLDRLRAGIELALKGYLEPGVFGSARTARPRLPAVEVYCVHGDADFSSEEWRGRARSWLESYGIALDVGSYRSADALFQWPQDERHGRGVSSHVLVIARERYLARMGSVEAYGGVGNAICYRAKDELDGLVSAIAIRRLLRQARKATEELRQRVFRRIEAGTRGFRLKRVSLPAGLHTELMGQSIVLSRLKAEFFRGEEWIAYSMRGWNELKVEPQLESGESGESGLDKNVVQRIHLELETVQSHLDVARDAYGNYYMAHHTRAMLWLTFAVLVLAVVQVGVVLDLSAWGGALVEDIAQIVGGWLQ